MKKYIIGISQLAIFLLVFVLLSGMILSARVFAQKSQKTPKTVWYGEFTMTIKGNGTQKPEPGVNDSEITWKIDRTYSGSFELTGPHSERKTGMRLKEELKIIKPGVINVYRSVNKNPQPTDKRILMPFHVTINDEVKTFSEGEGEGSAFENVTVIQKWKADANEFAGMPVELIIDNNSATYFIVIPIDSMSNSKRLDITSQTIYDRSSFGYGDAKTHEEMDIIPTEDTIDSLKMPTVKGILTLKLIAHWKDLPLPLNFLEGWKWDSGPLKPESPLLKDIPESKTKVVVRVTYRISSKPIY